MQLSDAEIRAIVRASIARRAQAGPATGPATRPAAVHASHVLFTLDRERPGGDSCLIEPAVRCSHCGYCLSYGH